MNRSALLAVAAGVFGATLLVAAIKGSIFGVAFGLLLSPLPLAMAVLGLGPAVLPVAVMGGAVTVTILTGSFVGPVIYLLNDVVPIALLARFARGGIDGTAPWSKALGFGLVWLAIGSSAVMALVMVMMPVGPDGLEASLKAGVDRLLAEMVRAGGGTAQMSQAAETLKASASLLPGAAGWNWCLRAIASTVLGLVAARRLGYAVDVKPAYREVAVPGWFIAVFWAAVAVGWSVTGDLGFIAKNAAMIMCLPLMLQGLAVVHVSVGRLANAGFWLAGFYVLALLTLALSSAALVGLGVVDHFLKLRARMGGPRQGGV